MGDDKGERWRWVDALSELIARGHRDPQRYTPAQIHVFIDAIERSEKRRRRDRIIERRIAALPAEEFAKAMRQLDEE